MLLVLELDVADLAATRFAISPLCETLKAVQLLGTSRPPSVNRPWGRWARAELDRRPLRLPRLWPLVATDLPCWPEFLVPAPSGQSPGFGEELACLCATQAEPVRASLRRVFGDGRWPDSATELFERPQESLEQIAAELAECHDRLIVPHWGRIRSVLDADIAYHAVRLARGGALAAVKSLLGAPRARLLAALRSPATTSALARRLGVTPGAVSQHLAVLHRGGLVDRRRSGRTVLSQVSELGLALLRSAS